MRCLILLIVAIPFIISCSNHPKDQSSNEFHYQCDSGKKFFIQAESDASPATREKALQYFAKLYGEKPEDCHQV